MANDLEKYNHLNYKSGSNVESDKFIDFLMENSTIEAPEIDENIAWDKLRGQIESPKKNFGWIRIAASIAIIFSISLTVFLLNSHPEEVFVSSLDQKQTITFPDGSLGVLNENSSFAYLDKFGDERRVSFEGEAYFDIKKSQKPFIIDMNGVEVKVLGTAFNLITSDENVSLYVDRGLVAFSKDGVDTKVKAGLEAIFDKETNEVTIKEIASNNIMSWRDGYFKFDKTPLNKVLEDLSNYYDVKFKLTNDNLNTCRVSGVIDKKPLSEALDLIESVLNVKTNVKDKTVKISGKGC
ncbi:MAG: FecR domain-containing protein [Bacteroidota bacterium]